MSENNTQGKPLEALTKEEKVEFLKTMFSTLEIDTKAEFAQWCHEEIEKGVGPLLGQKMQEVNDKMNSFIARASDKIGAGAKFVYEKTNEAFEVRPEDVRKDKKEEGESFFN